MSSRRLARLTLVTGALVVMTMAGHAAASATVPTGLGALITVLLAGGLTTAVSERRMSFASLLAYLLGAQALLHVVLAVAGHHGQPLVPSLSMMAAHALAAVGSAVVLTEAESILDRWARLLRRALGSPCPTLPEIPERSTGRTTSDVTPSTLRCLQHAVELRGPPSLAVPLAH